MKKCFGDFHCSLDDPQNYLIPIHRRHSSYKRTTRGWSFHPSSSICRPTNNSTEPTWKIHLEKRPSVWDPSRRNLLWLRLWTARWCLQGPCLSFWLPDPDLPCSAGARPCPSQRGLSWQSRANWTRLAGLQYRMSDGGCGGCGRSLQQQNHPSIDPTKMYERYFLTSLSSQDHSYLPYKKSLSTRCLRLLLSSFLWSGLSRNIDGWRVIGLRRSQLHVWMYWIWMPWKIIHWPRQCWWSLLWQLCWRCTWLACIITILSDGWYQRTGGTL